ncbi:alpha/beta hydrolase [Pseudonocardia spinosispora]|uniref:alpha/beta hydrolase n=1 Tax=Pseudonocardia spinosispora TaxID=103441 RepID=UPI0004091390|nr:alpha/beta hydrolase [Pseudonocardia spinosispora]
MSVQALPFFSSGLRLDADLHLPSGAERDTRSPVVVVCSGYQGQKVIHPERFARALNPLGYAVLAFDYRGFGLSEGERGRLVPQEWVEDVRAGIDRLSTVPEVDPSRLALLGWGLGGGVVIAEAAEDPRVKAVACLNGVADGTRSTRGMHDDESWESLLRRVEADRSHRAMSGRSEIADPWDIVRLNLDDRTTEYVGEQLYQAPGFGTGVTLESADLLLRFSPERVVDRIAPRPLLIVHGGRNELYKPVEARSLYAQAGEPKRLELLPDRGHTEWMFDDDPTFKRVVALLDEFLHAALGG